MRAGGWSPPTAFGHAFQVELISLSYPLLDPLALCCGVSLAGILGQAYDGDDISVSGELDHLKDLALEQSLQAPGPAGHRPKFKHGPINLCALLSALCSLPFALCLLLYVCVLVSWLSALSSPGLSSSKHICSLFVPYPKHEV